MIDSAKEKQLENAKKEAQMAKQREVMMYAQDESQQDEEEEVVYVKTASCASSFQSIPKRNFSRAPGRLAPGRGRRRGSAADQPMSRNTLGSPGQPTSRNNIMNTEKIIQNKNNNVGQQASTSTNLLNLDTTNALDFTMIPKALDKKFEEFAKNEKYAGTLRSVVIKVGEHWKKKSQPNLLSPIQTSVMRSEEQTMEKNRAFDLLDALSRSGSLDISCAELHVIVASSHSFDKAVVNTVVQDNINPIEKIERSHLLVASMIHGVGCRELVRDENDYDRIAQSSPLFITE